MKITSEEIQLTKECLAMATEEGAEKARVTLNKSVMDLFSTLNGEIDKVSHCLDRSLTLNLFVDGRYATFSTNRLSRESLRAFVAKAVDASKMLAVDPLRNLPDPSRCEKNAVSGDELGLLDPDYDEVTSEKRRSTALEASGFGGNVSGLISEEGEYSDSLYDTLVVDTQGLYCRHTETSFEYGVEVTIQDEEGNRHSGFWWDASSRLSGLRASECFDKALSRARSQIGAKPFRNGKFKMVVDTECASRLLTPVLNALGGGALQQHNSFLVDSLGQKVFSDGMTVIDKARSVGETGSRLFDSEGVATVETPVIENGVVKEYFINTYMSGKMNLEPTVEDVTRPAVERWVSPSLGGKEGRLDSSALMELLGEGIYVTGFNGGNSNSSTGDFSFGIEGYVFKDGKIGPAVHEMLMTGNFITLWNNLLAAGDDCRLCLSKLTPSLAFKDVDFSA